MSLDRAGDAEVEIFNLNGELVATLRAGLPAGTGSLVWRCGNVAPGIYLARVSANGETQTVKIAVVR